MNGPITDGHQLGADEEMNLGSVEGAHIECSAKGVTFDQGHPDVPSVKELLLLGDYVSRQERGDLLVGENRLITILATDRPQHIEELGPQAEKLTLARLFGMARPRQERRRSPISRLGPGAATQIRTRQGIELTLHDGLNLRYVECPPVESSLKGGGTQNHTGISHVEQALGLDEIL